MTVSTEIAALGMGLRTNVRSVPEIVFVAVTGKQMNGAPPIELDIYDV